MSLAGTRCALIARMIRALAVAAVVLAATGQSASAGVYGSLGIGNTGVDAGSAYGVNNDARSYSIAAGYDFTKFLGAEGGYTGFGTQLNSAQYSGAEYYAAGLVHIPISDGFWGFGRVGVQHSDMNVTMGNGPELEGTGYLFGAGFEYRIVQTILPVPHLAAWVGYTRNNSTLTNQERTDTTVPMGVSMWSLGITVGL
jgi:outer membrane protein with beta-barrel domain